MAFAVEAELPEVAAGKRLRYLVDDRRARSRIRYQSGEALIVEAVSRAACPCFSLMTSTATRSYRPLIDTVLGSVIPPTKEHDVTPKTRKRTLILAAIATVTVGGSAAVAGATRADDDSSDTPIPAAELVRASSAALAHTGGGRVTETEVGDEDGYYEVEITRADGSQVDVHLDRDFTVSGTKADRETEGDA